MRWIDPKPFCNLKNTWILVKCWSVLNSSRSRVHHHERTCHLTRWKSFLHSRLVNWNFHFQSITCKGTGHNWTGPTFCSEIKFLFEAIFVLWNYYCVIFWCGNVKHCNSELHLKCNFNHFRCSAQMCNEIFLFSS